MDRAALCVFVRSEGNSSDFILKIKFLCNNTLNFKIKRCILFWYGCNMPTKYFKINKHKTTIRKNSVLKSVSTVTSETLLNIEQLSMNAYKSATELNANSEKNYMTVL